MTVITQIFMQCDLCHETFPDSLFESWQECTEDAKESGWKFCKEKGDICPECVKNEKL